VVPFAVLNESILSSSAKAASDEIAGTDTNSKIHRYRYKYKYKSQAVACRLSFMSKILRLASSVAYGLFRIGRGEEEEKKRKRGRVCDWASVSHSKLEVNEIKT